MIESLKERIMREEAKRSNWLGPARLGHGSYVWKSESENIGVKTENRSGSYPR
jgi:hypothetical protein